LNEDTTTATKCSPLTLVSGYIRFVQCGYSWVPWIGGERQRGCRQQSFSVLSLAISSEHLEIKPSDVESLASAFDDPKTYDLEWLFNSVFAPAGRG